jgi:hypothetical protein
MHPPHPNTGSTLVEAPLHACVPCAWACPSPALARRAGPAHAHKSGPHQTKSVGSPISKHFGGHPPNTLDAGARAFEDETKHPTPQQGPPTITQRKHTAPRAHACVLPRACMAHSAVLCEYTATATWPPTPRITAPSTLRPPITGPRPPTIRTGIESAVLLIAGIHRAAPHLQGNEESAKVIVYHVFPLPGPLTPANRARVPPTLPASAARRAAVAAPAYACVPHASGARRGRGRAAARACPGFSAGFLFRRAAFLSQRPPCVIPPVSALLLLTQDPARSVRSVRFVAPSQGAVFAPHGVSRNPPFYFLLSSHHFPPGSCPRPCPPLRYGLTAAGALLPAPRGAARRDPLFFMKDAYPWPPWMRWMLVLGRLVPRLAAAGGRRRRFCACGPARFAPALGHVRALQARPTLPTLFVHIAPQACDLELGLPKPTRFGCTWDAPPRGGCDL